jgi:hypothetical protein
MRFRRVVNRQIGKDHIELTAACWIEEIPPDDLALALDFRVSRDVLPSVLNRTWVDVDRQDLFGSTQWCEDSQNATTRSNVEKTFTLDLHGAGHQACRIRHARVTRKNRPPHAEPLASKWYLHHILSTLRFG